MQFALPSNLQTELLAYDPTLKALAKQEAPKAAPKKAKYPLGNIPHLIPHNVVRESDQQAAIDQINQQLAPNRYRVFTTPVDVATPQARLKVIAILYHYEQVWYAAWLPPKQQADEYVYGYGYAFKNTSAASKTAPHHIWNSKDKCITHDIGRGSQVFTYMENVTKDVLTTFNKYESYTNDKWRASNLYCQKGHDIRDNAVVPFEKSLRENLPTWEDSRSMFDRIRCNNIFDAIELGASVRKYINEDDGLTVDGLIQASKKYVDEFPGTTVHYSTLSQVEHIITKPAIRKVLQGYLDDSVATYNNPQNKTRKEIKYGFNTFLHIANSIHWINEIWPDCPLDYYQNYMAELRDIRISRTRTNHQLIYWLREYMPVASMFTLLRKYLETETANSAERNHRFIDSEFGRAVYTFYALNDTFSMIIRILENGKTLETPKRWRIDEFHDYVQAEAWKIQNPKESLHQDLFPEPIKVQHDQQTWAFFQPVDTHQLAMWGQAVRNCVGSASHYADDIKKRKHFIVLCMIDGKPMFTIQLNVDNGLMSVKQISGVANQRLTEDQREDYTATFRQALRIREEQLGSNS